MIPINDAKSYYDIDKHNAYPTIHYIYNETGEDMVVLAGSEIRANAEIRQIADEIKSYLAANKLRSTFNYMEYLVAFDSEWRNEWIRMVANVIYTEYALSDETRQEAIERLVNSSTLFSIERLIIKDYAYREGY